MKVLLVFAVSLALFASTDPAPPPVAIPSTAVKGDDGCYRYTDSHGRKWIYRRTPFGVAHWEDKPADPAVKAAEASTLESIKATEDGDTVHFERPGPFGVYKWQRKKTELDPMEKAVWEREKARAAKQD